jgi:site-specific recombinase XerD
MPDMLINLETKQAYDLDSTLSLFLEGLAINTQKKYHIAISHFSNWLSEHSINLLSCDELSALSYLNYYAQSPAQRFKHRLQAEKVSKYTISQRATILHSLYKFLIRYGVADHDPFLPSLDKFRKAKSGDRRATEMVPFEKVKLLLDIPSPFTPEGMRDRCLLALLFGCGLRISEALGLLLCDIKQTVEGAWYLLLRNTKSQHCQQQPLPEWVAERVISYIKQRADKEQAEQHHTLFSAYRPYGGVTGALTVTKAYRIFRAYMRDAGLPPAYSPHSARATAITKLLSVNDMTYREVQEFSRHSNVQMLQVYDKRRFNIENSPGLKLTY